jgi:outer membrane protein TolC
MEGLRRATSPLFALLALCAGAGAQDRPDPLPAATPPPPTSLTTAPIAPDTLDGLVSPIDFSSCLYLAGANDLDVAIARERVCQSLAVLSEARAAWLPSLYVGPNWIRHDGQTQIVEGQVMPISKSSLFLGATGAAGQGITGPIPAGGPAPVGGLTSVLRLSDAILEPLVARRGVEARRAGVQIATNDALRGAALAYLDLQEAAGRLAVAREATARAQDLERLTGTYLRSGKGLEADNRRAGAEVLRRRADVEAAVATLESASAELVRRLRLDQRLVVAPVEPPEMALELFGTGAGSGLDLDTLIVTGLRCRPELAEARATVEATLARLKQARLRPLVPSLAFRYSGGGFGGGRNDFFGDFGGRSDVDVNLFWTVQNLGFADRALVRQRAAQQKQTALELLKVQDRVAAEVTAAERNRLASSRRVEFASQAVPEALQSLELNLSSLKRGAGLPGATRPLEVLQPIQALAQARTDHLMAVLALNRAQVELAYAIGRPAGGTTNVTTTSTTSMTPPPPPR